MMKKHDEKTNTKTVPPEILSKILLFTDHRPVKHLLDSPRVLSVVSRDPAFWNAHCDTTGLTIPECQSILRRRHFLVKNIKIGAECLRTFKTCQSDMTHLQIHGNLIYTASDDQTVKAFGMNGEFAKKFVDHSGGVWALDLSGDILVTGSTDKTARLWNIPHGTAIHSLRVHRSTVRAVRIHGSHVLTASRDSTIAVWRLNGSLQHVLTGHLQSVRCLDADSHYAVSGSYDCTVKLWDYRRGVLVKELPSHRKRVYAVKIHGGYVASGGLDSEVKITRITDGLTFGHSEHGSLVLWLDFAGRSLISASLDGTIINYDYIERRVVYAIRENSMIKHQKVHKNLLLIGTSTEAKVYSLKTGKLIRVLLSTYMITRLDMDDNVIVVGYSYDGECYVSIFDYRFAKQD